MYMIREVLYCRPGKVRPLVEKFQRLNSVMDGMGIDPFRIYTDVSGEAFWTLVLESEAESLEAFRETEARVLSDEDARAAMEGYHDLVRQGRREIYHVED